MGVLTGQRPKASESSGFDAKINQGRLAGKIRGGGPNYLNLMWVFCRVGCGALRRGDVMRKCLDRVIHHGWEKLDGLGDS